MGGIYAPYLHPRSTGKDVHFTLSLWNANDVMLMHGAGLSRGSGTPPGTLGERVQRGEHVRRTPRGRVNRSATFHAAESDRAVEFVSEIATPGIKDVGLDLLGNRFRAVGHHPLTHLGGIWSAVAPGRVSAVSSMVASRALPALGEHKAASVLQGISLMRAPLSGA